MNAMNESNSGQSQSEFQGEFMPEENPIQILAIVNTLLRRRWMIAGWTFALVVD